MTTEVEARFEALHARATDQTGLTDFGGTDYHDGLRVLLESLDEGWLGPMEVAAAEGLVVETLVSRLKTEAQWKAHPEFARRAIVAPLIVIGVPRTGTTALYNLLSQDPQFQGIEKWLCDAPLVRPARETWESHPQYRACVAAVEQMTALAPQAMLAHGVRPDDVDECLVPMAQSFCSNSFPSQLDLPRYDRWLLTADETASYRRYKDVLRLVGLNDDRRWLLKNPSHVFGIHALLAVFPDALVVQTHRHPAASLGSVVNLLDNFMTAVTGKSINRARRLEREAAFWAEGVRRTMAAQDRHPDRFVNVLQQDIRRDPLGVVHRIYGTFGLNLSAEAERAMREWADRNAESGGEGHSYDRLDRDDPLVEPFKPYVQRYAL
ncbi:sulfotransferase family protein [Sphingomonas pokkalii]|uniref:Sulfotransferase n=1 Tax=Sphingomonas pokkalii TaxID=2175090 RepID=A0A2U0SB81_9SPHN|nr:sulfotransferase [Sphingomonas pokkalii]PVX28609.1 sulfotransferase [Sphingomonas pokkalii]